MATQREYEEVGEEEECEWSDQNSDYSIEDDEEEISNLQRFRYPNNMLFIHNRHGFAAAYQHLYINDLIVGAIPSYPQRSEEEEDNDLDRFLTEEGRSMVYRRSVGGYTYIQPIHVYGPSMFHDFCHNTCGFCTELRDRFFNARSRHYDVIESQLSGHLDVIPIDQDVFEYMSDTGLSYRVEGTRFEIVDQPIGFFQPVIGDRAPVMLQLQQQGQCSVCMDPVEEEQLAMRIGCGHLFHQICLQTWANSNEASSSSCPLCRQDFNMLNAESGSDTVDNYDIVFPRQVEYVATPQLGNNEYDDPVSWIDLEHREGKYQCYIITGTLTEGHIWFSGPMIQITDMKDNHITQYKDTFTYHTLGEYEIEVVASKPIEMEIRTKKTSISSDQRVQFFIIGTYGDVRPVQLYVEEIRSLGHVAQMVGPDNYAADIQFDWKDYEAVFRDSSASILPSIELIKKSTKFVEWSNMFRKCIEDFKPTLIIHPPLMLCIGWLAREYGIPTRSVYSIPNNEGAYSYIEPVTAWDKVIARGTEHVICSMMHSVGMFQAIFEGHGKLNIPQNPELLPTIAPEIHTGGLGVLMINTPTREKFEYDIAFTVGSMVGDAVLMRYIRLLKQVKHRVLFQHATKRGKEDNITFVGACNHEDVFKSIPVVICHGGSGTLQTALRWGCRVRIHPFWVDQKFWPTKVKPHGFDAELLPEKDLDILRQLNELVKLGRARYRLTTVTPYDIACILLRIPVDKDKEGVFIYSRPLEGLIRNAAILENVLWGDARTEHTGIGYNKNGFTHYMELGIDGMTVQFEKYYGEGIDRRITHTKFIDMPYDENIFQRLLPTTYTGVTTNCRTAVDSYLSHYKKPSLEKWHQERKNGYTVKRGFGQPWKLVSKKYMHNIVAKVMDFTQQLAPKPNSMMFDIPHVFYDAPGDGDCLFASVGKVENISVKELKALTLPYLNDLLEEMRMSKLKAIPRYNTMVGEMAYGDAIPLCIAQALNIRILIIEEETGIRWVINETSGVRATRYLRRFPLGEGHYGAYVVTAPTVNGQLSDRIGFIEDAKPILPLEGNIDNVSVMAVTLKIQEIEHTYGLGKPRVTTDGGWMDSIFIYGHERVIKTTFAYQNTEFIERWNQTVQVDGEERTLYIVLMKYLYDDGLPIDLAWVKWPVRDGVVLKHSDDEHRNNFRSCGGIAYPIDQYCTDAPTVKKPPDILNKKNYVTKQVAQWYVRNR